MTKLKGTFQIMGWDEAPWKEDDDGKKQSHAKISQHYCGDINGKSELQYLMSYQAADKAKFVGFEVIDASYHGQLGKLVLQHMGKFEQGIASSDFVVLQAEGAFAGWMGDGRFRSSEHGQADYEFCLNNL